MAEKVFDIDLSELLIDDYTPRVKAETGRGGEDYLSKYVYVTNPSSPLWGKRGRVLGNHKGDYIEISISPDEYPYVLKQEEVSICQGKEE